jgi:hypothetical protein
MSFDLFPDLFLLLEVILFFGFTLFAFIKAQRITKSTSYFWLIIGLITNLIGYGFLISTLFFPNLSENEKIVLTLAIITNIVFGLGFLLIMNGLILIREDKLPLFSHIAALLVGVSSMLFGFVDSSQLSFNETTLYWEIDYLSGNFRFVFLAVSISILVIFIVYFVLYLVRKFYKWYRRRNFDITFIGFTFLAVWMITPFFQASKVFRQFFLPAAFLCWGIAVFLDPLNMLVSNKVPEEVILTSKTDHPIFRYNLKDKQIVHNLEEIRMLIAGRKIISESLNSEEKPKDLRLRNKEIKYINLSQFNFIAIGTRIDRNSQAAIIKSFKEMCKETDLQYLETATVLKESDENLLANLLLENFSSIDASRNNN